MQYSDTNIGKYWSNPQTIFNVKSIVYCHATIYFFFQVKLALVKGKNVVIVHNTFFKNAHLVSFLKDSLKQVKFF